jgi:outer membrane immunogenic protein
MWTGFYAGLNAGYGWGTSTNVTTVGSPLYDGYALYYGRMVSPDNPEEGPFGPLPVGVPGLMSMAHVGAGNVNQQGFIGGGQIGYNYQWGPSFVIGIEADMQGTSIGGTGRYAGAVADGGDFPKGEGGYKYAGRPFGVSRVGMGGGSIDTGVNWMGTVRGRLGWLATPTLMVFGTGGLAYGGVYTRVNSYELGTVTYNLGAGEKEQESAATGSGSFLGVGGGAQNKTLVGWSAGGGFEWMFMPNWSVKAEAIYYDLGSATTYGLVGTPGGSAIAGNGNWKNFTYEGWSTGTATKVRFDGVIARAGVNYHFNWGASAPVVAKY